MRKILGGLLLVLGLIALALGWAGTTVWAPSTEHTATVTLDDAGVAVLLEPGVMYAGGHEGEVRFTSSEEITLITAPAGDAAAYLDGVKHTALTGVPEWGTISTEVRNEDSEEKVANIASSDLWQKVSEPNTNAAISIAEFSREESSPTSQQPYRAVIAVADGDKPVSGTVSMSWPTDARIVWPAYAYAAGAVLAIIGLVILLLVWTSSRSLKEEMHEAIEDDDAELESETSETSGSAEPHEDAEHQASDESAPAARPHGRRRAAVDGAETTSMTKPIEETER